MSPDPIAIARDISIIIMCVMAIVALLVTALIGWKLFQLVSLVKSKTEELGVLGGALMMSARETAETAGETMTTVKGSAEFISDTVVHPVVQVMSAVAGAQSFVAALFRLRSSPKDGGRS